MPVSRPLVESVFHADTRTFSHAACAQPGGAAIVIDPALDDPRLPLDQIGSHA